MSKYTIELSELVNSITYGSNSNFSQRITESLSTIFNFDFPIWNESYRQTLERKIIMHYISYEIGFETVELWQLYLEEKLNRIMPYYNKMYLSTIAEYDITKDFNRTVSISDTTNITNDNHDEIENTDNENGSHTGNNSNNNTINNKTEQVDYDIPQSKNNTNTDYASFLEDNTTNGTNNNSITINENTTNTKTNNFTKTTHGTSGNVSIKSHDESGNNTNISELLIKYRESLINLDNLIIEELHDLFMLIF